MKLKDKKCQEVKINFPCLTSKRGQEEIIGFGVILILIAVIGVIFISINLNKISQKQEVEDYESLSFLKAVIETTTECEKNTKFLSVKDLSFECQRNYICYNEENSCEVLKDILEEIMKESLVAGEDFPIKGYQLLVESDEEVMVNITKGDFDEKSSFKGASQGYSKFSDDIGFYIKIYY